MVASSANFYYDATGRTRVAILIANRPEGVPPACRNSQNTWLPSYEL